MTKDPVIEAEKALKDFYPENSLPVDPFKIAYHMGLTVLLAELPDSVSGAIVLKNRNQRIFINNKDNIFRQKFTCAHEIGHFIDHDKKNDPNFEHTDYRGLSAQKSTEKRDIFANQFAANLLMPQKDFAFHYKKFNGDLYPVAAIFGVSYEAAIHRESVLKRMKIV